MKNMKISSTRLRRRVGVAVAVVGFGLLFAPFGVGGQSAAASQCDPELQTVCATAATVICKVLAKGNPCLK